MFTPRIRAALALFVAGAQTSCVLECTLIGCTPWNGTVLLEPHLTEPGAYRFEIERDDRPGTCVITYPAPSPPASQFGSDPCSAELTNFYTQDGSPDIGAVQWYGEPSRITVRIYRDDELIASGTERPTYTEHSPNGEACGPSCVNAGFTLRTEAL